tara:strand:+ start:91 stop:933 length:843 start_codon:yes stop_codon:yes gene_type:complete
MPFTWDLDTTLIGKTALSDTIQERENKIDPNLLPKSGWAKSYEALPMFLHRAINCGEREYMSRGAVLLYNVDIVLRAGATLLGGVLAYYLLLTNRLLRDALPLDEPGSFMPIVLVVWYVELALHAMLALYGRWVRLSTKLDEEEARQTQSLQLPLLLFNYQSFGYDRWSALLPGLLVSVWVLIYTVGWAVMVYEMTVRSLADDPYRGVWIATWSFLLAQNLITALARSSSFNKLRSVANKYNDDPDAVEQTRITLACFYIYWTMVVLLPMGVTGIVYVSI